MLAPTNADQFYFYLQKTKGQEISILAVVFCIFVSIWACTLQAATDLFFKFEDLN